MIQLSASLQTELMSPELMACGMWLTCRLPSHNLNQQAQEGPACCYCTKMKVAGEVSLAWQLRHFIVALNSKVRPNKFDSKVFLLSTRHRYWSKRSMLIAMKA